MSSLSIGEAYGAGLRLIARKPLAPLVWGLVVFAVICLPVALVVTSVIPHVFRAVQESAAAGQAASPAPVFAAFGSMMMLQPVFFLGSIVVRAVLFAAVFRAVFEPERSGAFYMRLGTDELWQGLVFLCLQILLGFAAVALIFPLMFGLMGSVAASASGSQGGAAVLQAIPAFMAMMLIVGAVMLWLAVRLSLALPMTFTDRQFRLFESWGATRGHTMALIGLALLQVATLLALQTIVAGLAFGLIFALLGNVSEAGWTHWTNRPAQIWGPGLTLTILGFCLIASILSGYLAAFLYAPWADAWRQIKGDYRSDHFGPAPSTAPLG